VSKAKSGDVGKMVDAQAKGKGAQKPAVKRRAGELDQRTSKSAPKKV